MSNHRRFLIPPEQISGETAILTGDSAHQILKVLRLKEGEGICLLDGSGNEYGAWITTLSKDQVTARIKKGSSCKGEPVHKLSLAMCLPKSDKIELVVQKCTELGISDLVILNSDRTIPNLEGSRLKDRLERWRRIAAESAEQCLRGKAPEIKGIIEFTDLGDAIRGSDLALIAWEEEEITPLKDALRQHADAGSVILIIGPEGGLTEAEVETAKAAGAISVSLGMRLLRTETAAIGACAAIMYELEGEL